MLFVNEGFTFRNFLVDVFTVFVFIAWFWLLITVFMDLFRRHDISGWAKAIWVIALIIFPLLAVLAYLITQSRGMAERNTQQAQQARDELRRVVGFSAADEIEKLDRLKKAGSITDAEFARCAQSLFNSQRWSWSAQLRVRAPRCGPELLHQLQQMRRSACFGQKTRQVTAHSPA